MHYVFACAMPLHRMERRCSFDKISLVFQDPAHLSHPPRSLFLGIPSPLPSQREKPQPQPCVPNVPCTYHSLNYCSMAFSFYFLCLPSQLLWVLWGEKDVLFTSVSPGLSSVPDSEQERKEGSKDLLRDRFGREMGRDRRKLVSSNLTTLPGGR